MAAKQYTWHKIAETDQELVLGPNGIGVIEVKGKKICVTQFKEAWYGFAFKCPHAGGFMSDGYIDPIGNVVCPLHRYKFNIQNGRNTSGEGYYLKTWPVESRPDGIFIGMEESGLFNWF